MVGMNRRIEVLPSASSTCGSGLRPGFGDLGASYLSDGGVGMLSPGDRPRRTGSFGSTLPGQPDHVPPGDLSRGYSAAPKV